MNIPILYENSDVLVINKPAGLLVHGVYGKEGAKHAEKTLVDWLLQNYPGIAGVGDALPNGTIERAGIVHRLDRETSGVMVIAKNQEAFKFLKDQFQKRNVKKIYTALVWGRVKNQKGVIDKPISIKDGSVKRTVYKGKMAREASTEYEVAERFSLKGQEMTLLKVTPKTGRTHQIRVHLNSIGHPVLGDKLYGKKPQLESLKRHFLHAKFLEFSPSGKRKITATAELSAELVDFINKLEKN
jgi:23S rRNA pseudouridine1911/1915/1917 synthase